MYGTAPLCYKDTVQYGVSSAVGRIVSRYEVLCLCRADAFLLFWAGYFVALGAGCWSSLSDEGWLEPWKGFLYSFTLNNKVSII